MQISCFAPRRFGGSTFELFGAGSREPLGRLVAEAGQHRARFLLNGTAAAFRCYRGRYRSFDGRTWWESELSAAVPLSGAWGGGEEGGGEVRRPDAGQQRVGLNVKCGADPKVCAEMWGWDPKALG